MRRQRPRYKVASVLGYHIRLDRNGERIWTSGGKKRALRSFSVLDTLANHRIVSEFVTFGSTSTEAKNMRAAYELCARLNAEHEARLARDAAR